MPARTARGGSAASRTRQGTASYAYSAKGELIKETKVTQGRTYVTSYSFDKNGSLSAITYPSGRKVTYATDAADRVSSVTTIPGRHDHDARRFRRPQALRRNAILNDIRQRPGADGGIRPAIPHLLPSTGAVQNLSYAHDPNGNITKITDVNQPHQEQDLQHTTPWIASRAPPAPGGASPGRTIRVGNRQTQVENGATSTYTYQTGTNKLTGVTGAQASLSFSLDPNGNTTSENAKTFTYNQNNRLIKASESGSTKGQYTFNASGQRATKKPSAASARVFHHDQSGNLIAETTSAGATVAEYIHLEGQPLAKIDSGGTRYIHPDHLATPQVMTSSTGATVWQIEAKPFGDGASITGTALLNLRFPGQYYDQETGLHQNWFRDYMPKVGRYLEPDRVTIASALYQTALAHRNLRSSRDTDAIVWHYHLLSQKRLRVLTLLWEPERQDPYPYAGNNPLTMIDENGELAQAVGGVIAIALPLGGAGLGIYCYITCNKCTSPGNCDNYPNYNDPDGGAQSLSNWNNSNSNCTTACFTGTLTIGYNALSTAAKAVGKKVSQCLLGN